MSEQPKNGNGSGSGITWKILALASCALLVSLVIYTFTNLTNKVSATDAKIDEHEKMQGASDILMDRKVNWLITATSMLADKQGIKLPPIPAQ